METGSASFGSCGLGDGVSVYSMVLSHPINGQLASGSFGSGAYLHSLAGVSGGGWVGVLISPSGVAMRFTKIFSIFLCVKKYLNAGINAPFQQYAALQKDDHC